MRVFWRKYGLHVNHDVAEDARNEGAFDGIQEHLGHRILTEIECLSTSRLYLQTGPIRAC